MNGLPYYKAYPRDFVEGTVGMSFELKSAYRLVLDIIYMRAGQLPDDSRYIAGVLGCSVRAWNKYRLNLIEMGKLNVKDGIISNSRADKELESLRKLQEKQSENRSRPNKNKDLQSPRFDHTEPEPEPDKKEGTNVPSKEGASPHSDAGKVCRFQEFWDVYPHRNGAKKGRADCEKRYQRAVKNGADEQEIIDGAKRYAGDAQVQRGYGKNPSTWLNQECWGDDVEKPETGNVVNFQGGGGGRQQGLLTWLNDGWFTYGKDHPHEYHTDGRVRDAWWIRKRDEAEMYAAIGGAI